MPDYVIQKVVKITEKNIRQKGFTDDHPLLVYGRADGLPSSLLSLWLYVCSIETIIYNQ